MEGILFVLKKVISKLAFPVGMVLLLGLLGLFMTPKDKRAGKGFWLILAAWLLLLILSLPVTGYFLLAPLEQQAGDYADTARLSAQGVKYIVVLGGGIKGESPNPIDSLSSSTLFRLTEGLRLWKAMPEAKLVLSGGRFGAGLKESQAMARAARELGMPGSDIVLESVSWDTGDQARELKKMLKGRPFALVTSASHMGRALAIFQSFGMNPAPAPTDFRTKDFKAAFSDFLPQAGGLKGSENAIYEYLGRLWAWIRY